MVNGKWIAFIYSSAFIQSAVQLSHIHPFKHRRRCQPCKVTTNTSGAGRVRGFAQGHQPGDRTSNRPVARQPLLPPELLPPLRCPSPWQTQLLLQCSVPEGHGAMNPRMAGELGGVRPLEDLVRNKPMVDGPAPWSSPGPGCFCWSSGPLWFICVLNAIYFILFYLVLCLFVRFHCNMIEMIDYDCFYPCCK